MASFLALLPGCGRKAEPVGLKPDTSSTTFTLAAPLGQSVYLGYLGISALGKYSVRITGAKLVGASQGLRLVKLWAVDKRRLGYGGMLAAREEDITRQGVVLEPAGRAVFVPGRRSDWFFLAQLSAAHRGSFRVRGVDLRWKASNGQSGSERFASGMVLTLQ